MATPRFKKGGSISKFPSFIIIIVVFVGCVWASNLDSVEPLSSTVFVEFAPTATAVPQPTTAECQQLLASWSVNTSQIMKEFENVISLGANNNHDDAYQAIARAHQSYQQISAPTCDTDAIEYHRLIGSVINDYVDAYHAMRTNNVATAHALFMQSFLSLNQANDVFARLRARYEQ